jgi:hypothetical protein
LLAPITRSPLLIASILLSLMSGSAMAQSYAKAGLLSCDVSAGIGMILVQKQKLRCTFTNNAGGPPDHYIGSISEYGVALGGVAAGHLVWGVLSAVSGGVPHGALAGSYGGVGGEASFGAGVGANVLVGGSNRAFSLQPISVEGQVGINVAAGITAVVLEPAP